MKKCTKFESIFLFRPKEELLDHISECSECAAEYEKMQKISDLIQEVKPYYQKELNKRKNYKIACSVLFIALFGFSLIAAGLNTDISDTLKYGTILSSEDLGFPVDSYGLIAVE